MKENQLLNAILRYKVILLIVVLAIFVRLIALGSVPYGFANDEVSYIMSGYSIALTNGYDIAGKFMPLSVNLDSSLSPVPVYLIAIFIKFFGLTPFVARLPFALLGVGTIITVYFICKELFKNEGIAILSSLIFSLSPWHILVTRSVWDVIPAQFFYLLGLLIFLKNVKKGNILWSLPFFLLGFFSYHGTKVFFAAYIVLLVIVFLGRLRLRKRELILFFVGVTAIFSLFAFVLKTQSVTRQEEIIFTNKGAVTEAKKNIDFERGKSSAPIKLAEFEDNKVSYYFQKMVTNYLSAFSTQYLFTTGDIHPLVGYGVFFKGVLYLIDIPFLVLGLMYFIEKSAFFSKKSDDHEFHLRDNQSMYRQSFIIVIGGLLVSPLPSTVAAGSSYFIRSFMMAPFLAILIGLGLYIFWKKTKSGRFKSIFIRSIVVILYIFFITRFLYQYYYQLNSFGSEYWNSSSRKLSEFIVSNKSRFDRVIIANVEDKVILQYAMVSQADPYELQVAWRKNWPVKLGNVTFANSCYKDEDLSRVLTPRTLYVVPSGCHENLKPQMTITDSLEPLRVIWKLYEN